MKSVVLHIGIGQPLAFLLCHPGLDQPAGECVLVPVPGRPKSWVGRMLDQRWPPAAEGRWVVIEREPLTIQVQLPTAGSGLFIILGGPSAEWGLEIGPDRQRIGQAELAAHSPGTPTA